MMLFKKTFSFLAITLSCIVLVSCEDDAILSPEPESDCTPGDSYCNLSLPSLDSKEDKEIKNPKVY
tara:strand:- start:524 stop:721 length:198 start_codon:yes stop_codon:yes gene_type:complete